MRKASYVVLGLLFVVASSRPCGAEETTSQTQVTAAIRAGAGKCSIVPPFPTRMAGFFDRVDTFTGVLTPVYARALVCDNGETQLAVVSMDLLSVSAGLVEASRTKASARTGIPPENILICAIHTHSAPSGYDPNSMFIAPVEQRLIEFLSDRVADAVTEANNALRPARVGFAYGQLTGITRNRQQGNTTAIDPDVGVLRIEEKDSRNPIAILFNFTGHPVILGEKNLQLCSEYPGVAAETIESLLDTVALFTQGACGDVTMIRSGSTFEEVQRLGRILAGEVVKTAEMIQPAEDVALWTRRALVAVQPRVLPRVAKAKKLYAATQKAFADAQAQKAGPLVLKHLERQMDDAEWAWRLADFDSKRPKVKAGKNQATVQVAQIGPLVIVGIPGELFVEYALEMKQRVRQMRNRPMILAGFANDYFGYLVTPRAWHTGGYEAASARVDQNAGRVLTEAAMALVEEHGQ